MTLTYTFRAAGQWTVGRQGQLQAPSVNLPLEFSAPPEFQGTPGLWTPEHFLLGAAAACFITTFRAIAEISRLEIAGLEVAAEGTVEKVEDGMQFTRILLRPVLTVKREQDQDRGLRLLQKAEHSCLVSRSLKAKIEMEPKVAVIANAE